MAEDALPERAVDVEPVQLLLKILRLAVPLLLMLVLPLSAVWAQTRAPVAVIELNGVIDSISSRYVVRAIDAAERNGRELLVIEMDTPGGLDTAMREMIRRILISEIPVVIFVGPDGARAASAGLFIAMAGHVAAMAPSTNIGAASPVSLGGDQSGQSDVLESKVTNDAAAYVRGLAESRGRNADWAESAVRESVSISAAEALELGVIDLIASDVDELLPLLDGREVSLPSGATTLQTQGLSYDRIGMNPVDSFLHILVDPNIAFLLFSLGGLALTVEIFSPGLIFPGVAGAISLILAFTAFGSLPVNWAGVGLIVLALALFALEAFVPSNGVLGGGGAVALVLGGLFLFQAPDVAGPASPEVRVSRILLTVVAVLAAVVVIILARTGMIARRASSAMRQIPLPDAVGETQSVLKPQGTVLVDSEEWTAESKSGRVPKGRLVRVLGSRGLTLVVEAVATDGSVRRTGERPAEDRKGRKES